MTIIFSFEEYEKIQSNSTNYKIKYEINSKQQEHSCNGIEKTELVGSEDIKTKEEEKQIAILLIKANLMEPPSFHINNLHNNKINWNKKRIENLVYKLQEEKYPNNNIFIKNIANIEINLGNINENTKKYKLCPRQCYFRIQKKNKDEHLIFLTTPFQINLLKETDILFFDGTFHSCPKSFYQVFNIIAHLKNKNVALPIMTVLMKNKYELSYINLFENFKLILYEHNIYFDTNKFI